MPVQPKLIVRSFILTLLLVIMILFSFQSAFAGQGDTANGNNVDVIEVTPFEAINYYLARHFNAYSIAVTGFLNPEVQLPAKVEIAVPAGSEIMWFSEFSGGPVANDPEIAEPFNVRTENNLDIYTVVLEHYPAVQIEYHIDHDPNVRLSDGVYSIRMEYTPAADVPIFRFITNLPEESTVQDPNIEFMGTDANGYLVFMRLYTDVQAFTSMQGEFTYMPPQGRGMIAEGGNLLGGVVTVVAIVIAALAGFAFVATRRQRQE